MSYKFQSDFCFLYLGFRFQSLLNKVVRFYLSPALSISLILTPRLISKNDSTLLRVSKKMSPYIFSLGIRFLRWIEVDRAVAYAS